MRDRDFDCFIITFGRNHATLPSAPCRLQRAAASPRRDSRHRRSNTFWSLLLHRSRFGSCCRHRRHLRIDPFAVQGGPAAYGRG